MTYGSCSSTLIPGKLNQWLGLEKSEGSLTIYDALLGDTPMADTVRPTLCEGLEMVTADKNLVAANLDLVDCLTGN